MHLFPRATWGLMLSLMVPVVLSFSGNLDLTAVALKGVEMADSLWWYYIIVSMIAPVLSNANGVIPFAQDLMNRLAINEWFFSDDNRRYANNEDFFKEFEVLLKKGLTNNKAAFESLLYFSQGSLEKVSTNDSEYTSHPLVKSLAKILKKGDLASIYKSIKFTPIDRKRIMCTLGLETKEEFDNYVAKMIESFDAVALPNENMENFLNNAENNTTNGENSIIILPENQPLLGKHRNSWFNCCRGKEEDDSENVSQNHTINNTRRINPESRPSCTLF
jgi:hypothetical protein